MLSRLTLVVTHTCNLQCRYCYADGGSFGLPKENMPPEMVVEVVDHFVERFGGLKELFFFGGEPLVAKDTVQAACRHAQTLVDNGRIGALPYFTIITNGTLIDEACALFLKQWNFSVTVSLDGPDEINDLNRVNAGGRGASAKTLGGIALLRTHGVPFNIEATYTYDHWVRGFSPRQVFDYLSALGADKVILSEEMKPDGEGRLRDADNWNAFYGQSLDLFAVQVDKALTCGECHHSGVVRTFDSLLNRPELLKDSFCGAGLNNFAVNPQGACYPCHMMVGQDKFALGRFDSISAPVDCVPGKGDIEVCQTCAYRGVCRACPARMHITSGGKSVQPTPKDCQVVAAFMNIAASALLEKTSC